MVKQTRSRSLRKIYRRVPSGVSRRFYKKRKPKSAKCAICKKPLHGLPKEKPSKLRKLSKSKKVPKRLFGGNLCSKCARREIIKRIRT